MSLRLQRRMTQQQATVTVATPLQTRREALGLGDWFTKCYGSYPYCIAVWDLVKGLIYGGTSYGFITWMGKPKSASDVALKAFLLGGTMSGAEQTLDQALAQVYGTDFCGSPANIDNLIHEALQGFIFDGLVSAGFAALFHSILK